MLALAASAAQAESCAAKSNWRNTDNSARVVVKARSSKAGWSLQPGKPANAAPAAVPTDSKAPTVYARSVKFSKGGVETVVNFWFKHTDGAKIPVTIVVHGKIGPWNALTDVPKVKPISVDGPACTRTFDSVDMVYTFDLSSLSTQ
ncbi:MAG: hypothetical protein GC201_15925 [Alphaproteobacteria bacterium]|nr:hypothetical protein [Alphaproteobacteria bacterium]